MKTKTTMSQKVLEYVKFKQDTGCKFEAETQELLSFASHIDRYYSGKSLRLFMVKKWVESRKNIKPITKLGMYCTLRGLARYLKLDDPQVELIPKNIFIAWFRRTAPYIYSNHEISLIMSAEPDMGRTHFETLCHRTVIGLLASTGMRIGEVLALQNADVNLKSGIITVRQFKKMPMRLIPVSQSVSAKLVEYIKKRNSQLGSSPQAAPFFINSKRKRISYASFKWVWNKTVMVAGLVKNNKIPRIHDFRHTFACNHLVRAYKEGRDIDDAIYTLSVYLGHTVIDGTYWYLSATPEILEECIKRTEKTLFNHNNGE